MKILLGVSAVEDKLQEGVSETITLLGAAGIKLWVRPILTSYVNVNTHAHILNLKYCKVFNDFH